MPEKGSGAVLEPAEFFLLFEPCLELHLGSPADGFCDGRLGERLLFLRLQCLVWVGRGSTRNAPRMNGWTRQKKV